MDDLAQQFDEIEALAAIYDDDWQIEDYENRSYSVKISDGDNCVKLYIKLPVDYPSKSPPQFEISAPHLRPAKKIHLLRLLDQVYISCMGDTVIYQSIEKIREELEVREISAKEKDIDDNGETIKIPPVIIESNTSDATAVYHGEVIVDRKSSFQGHAACVSSVDQVERVLKSLLENRKIEQATHNIYAYRIFCEEKKVFIHDCEDDGESQAGGRLLRLLEIVDAKNVLVVVSRWYGGIHLGPDRFRHINNAARRVLESCELIKKNRDHKK